ncbi:protein FAM117B-like [Hyaena hyaena]|uniref:protein FAM117B-like n=1 Tax=Hyaena hyaena TaxID=95912 RepID=UPI001923A31C|nr:protein FAM117B-like [Hyaena hyaena]
MRRGQPGRTVRSPRAVASLPAGRRRRRAGGLRNSPALSPALPFFSGGGGGGRDGAAHSGGSSAPGLSCSVLGGGGSGGGSGPTRAVTIVRGGRRSRAEPLSSRRRPWPTALAPPAPGALRRPRSALVLCACARRAPPPPAPARARSRAHSQSQGPGGSRAAPSTLAGDRLPGAHAAGSKRLRRRLPPRPPHAHCDTRLSDTRVLSHASNTRSGGRSHPHSPAATTWENWRG